MSLVAIGEMPGTFCTFLVQILCVAEDLMIFEGLCGFVSVGASVLWKGRNFDTETQQQMVHSGGTWASGLRVVRGKDASRGASVT